MSTETITRNPLLQEEGMTPKLLLEANTLRRAEDDALVEHIQKRSDRRDKMDLHELVYEDRGIIYGIHGALERRKIRRAGQARDDHFVDNEAAYQVQAVKDAEAEGINTNFGTKD